MTRPPWMTDGVIDRGFARPASGSFGGGHRACGCTICENVRRDVAAADLANHRAYKVGVEALDIVLRRARVSALTIERLSQVRDRYLAVAARRIRHAAVQLDLAGYVAGSTATFLAAVEESRRQTTGGASWSWYPPATYEGLPPDAFPYTRDVL